MEIDAALLVLQADEQFHWFQRKIADTILEAKVIQVVILPGRAPQILYDQKDEQLLGHLFNNRAWYIMRMYPEITIQAELMKTGNDEWVKCAEDEPKELGEFLVYIKEEDRITEGRYYGKGGWDDLDNNNIKPTHWRKKILKPKL